MNFAKQTAVDLDASIQLKRLQICLTSNFKKFKICIGRHVFVKEMNGLTISIEKSIEHPNILDLRKYNKEIIMVKQKQDK